MSKDTHIKIENVNLHYPIMGMNAVSLKNKILRWITFGKFSKNHEINTVHALNNISIEINHGDRVGIIGANGSGKSTFLKLLAQIYPHHSGKIDISGKISSILDLSLGLIPEASGYTNIKMHSIAHNIPKKDFNNLVENIMEFSELGDFLKLPLHSYSSGMRLRLAFGLATYSAPDILLIDEVYGVGDKHFREKAKKRMQKTIDNSSILVLASHDIDILKNLCTKIAIFEHGKIIKLGPTKDVLEYYAERKN